MISKCVCLCTRPSLSLILVLEEDEVGLTSACVFVCAPVDQYVGVTLSPLTNQSTSTGRLGWRNLEVCALWVVAVTVSSGCVAVI